MKHKKLTTKQLIFAKGKAAGLDNTAAAKAAGYACPMEQGSQTLRKIQNHPDFLAMMDRAGLSDNQLFKPIKDGLKATKTANFEGEVCSSDEPDHSERLKAAELAFKLRGRLKNKDEGQTQNNTQVNVYNFKDAKTEDLVRSIDEQLRELVKAEHDRAGRADEGMRQQHEAQG